MGSFFFFFPSSFFFSSPLSPQLACPFFPSLIFPPFSPCFPSFFLSTILFPFVFFLFYFLFPPFCSFSFSLSSLYFIFLISSSFSSPLSFSFLFVFSSLTQNDDFLWFVYSYDRSNWILTDQTGFDLPFWQTMLRILPYPLHCSSYNLQFSYQLCHHIPVFMFKVLHYASHQNRLNTCKCSKHLNTKIKYVPEIL